MDEDGYATPSFPSDPSSCWFCMSDAGDKRFRLRSLPADADRVGLRSNTLVAYIDIIITRRERITGMITQGDIAT
jgi:hypothetical protein